MSRREAWGSALFVGAVAILARLVAAVPIVFPRPEDTSYYVAVARNLLDGRGLVSDALWSYATPPLTLPHPAFEVWMPLPTFLAAIPMALLGQSFRVAQVMPVAAGAVLSVLAWRLAADIASERRLPAGRARVLAVGTGLTTAVYLPLLLYGVLPDSTVLFGALALGACLLMTRIRARHLGGQLLDPRLIGLGLLLGLAALTRNEAIWLALTWVALAWTIRNADAAARVRLVAVPAVVALAVVVPWLVRNELVFGSALPGQALSNALSINGTDIFAWADPPTLERYLAQGPVALLQLRVDGLAHNLFNVLLFLGFPVSFIGLIGLPWAVRGEAIRSLVLYSAVAFLVASLVFPVSSQWGTFLHASAPVQVLLVISALLALDATIAWVGVKRGWSRPVAWLGTTLAVVASILFSVALLPAFGAASRATELRYEGIGPVMAAAGLPIDGTPVITDFPIWLADTQRNPALALPHEAPSAVLDLARTFPGTHTVLTFGGLDDRWARLLEGGGPGAECFQEVPLTLPPDPELQAALRDARAWRIVCP